MPLQLAKELPNAPSASAYCRRQRTEELAVKKELSVLGIEAHDVGWQHIHAEIRRELQSIVEWKAVPAIARHNRASSGQRRKQGTARQVKPYHARHDNPSERVRHGERLPAYG